MTLNTNNVCARTFWILREVHFHKRDALTANKNLTGLWEVEEHQGLLTTQTQLHLEGNN